MTEQISIEEVQSVTLELVESFAKLLPQLSTSALPLGAADLSDIVAASNTRLLIARSGSDVSHPIVGSLTLELFRLPTGLRCWIEDLVVDEDFRGRGIGEALTRHAIELAQKAGARTVDLTSRPFRKEANRLYRRLGFELRESNVYRYTCN